MISREELTVYKAFSARALGFPLPLIDAIGAAGKNGFEGYWLDIRADLAPGLSRVRDALDRARMKAAGFGLPVDLRGDDHSFEEELGELPKWARLASELEIDRCMTWIAPASDKLDYEENFALHAARLRRAAGILAERGIRLGIEFVAPERARRGRRYGFIHTLDEVLELCAAIGTGNLGVVLDVWHWDLAGHSLGDFAKIRGEDRVIVVHLNDAPRAVPAEEQEDLARTLPGETGVLKIGPFFRGLLAMEYSGPALVEPFSAAVKAMRFDDAVSAAKRAIDAVWPREGTT